MAPTMLTKVPVDVAETIEERDGLVGKPGDTLETANDSDIWHKFNPGFRLHFVHELAKATNTELPLKETPKGDPAVKTVSMADGTELKLQQLKGVTELQVAKKVLADELITKEEYEKLARQVAGLHKIDYKSKKKSAQPKQEHIDNADALLIAVRAGQNSSTNIEDLCPQLTGQALESFGETPWEEFAAGDDDAAATLRDTLARMMKAYDEAQNLASAFAAS